MERDSACGCGGLVGSIGGTWHERSGVRTVDFSVNRRRRRKIGVSYLKQYVGCWRRWSSCKGKISNLLGITQFKTNATYNNQRLI